MASVAEDEKAVAIAAAIRGLLAAPLTNRSAPNFRTIALHEAELKAFFDEACGWVLTVDGLRGFARLRKINVGDDRSYPQRSHRSQTPFNKRRYVLFCLVNAALGEHDRSKIALQDLATALVDLTQLARVPTFDDLNSRDRAVLIDCLLLLQSVGVLDERDRTGSDYVSSRDANVLYQVDERLLGQLLVTAVPPSRCATWQQMSGEHDSYPRTTATGTNRAVRQRLVRQLFDHPVIYRDDLDAGEWRTMDTEANIVAGYLATAGLILERRADAWMVVDRQPSPGRSLRSGSNVANAALLLLEELTGATDGDWASDHRVSDLIETIFDDHPWWARKLRDDPHRNAEILGLLQRFHLVRPDADGWRVLPAAWRWTTRVDPTSSPSAVAAADKSTSWQPDLFEQEQSRV